MAKKQAGLPRDFYDLIDDNTVDESAGTSLRINCLIPRKNQPRKQFDTEALQSLADSIREVGVIQPIAVRPIYDDIGRPTETYEIISGERRFRAASLAGLDEIPAVVLNIDDAKVAQISLIENLQREDLNPIEEAAAYKSLLTEYGMTQEQVASQVGKSRSAVANMMRLLDLSAPVAELVKSGDLSAGHARALLGLDDPAMQETLAKRFIDTGMSVREAEKAVAKQNALSQIEREGNDAESEPADPMQAQIDSWYDRIRENMQRQLGRKVVINRKGRKKTVEITYSDDDDLTELLKKIGGDNVLD